MAESCDGGGCAGGEHSLDLAWFLRVQEEIGDVR